MITSIHITTEKMFVNITRKLLTQNDKTLIIK
jgi:hypothetical protein